MPISREDFEFVQTLTHQRSGIMVEVGKEYLVESRLEFLARREGYNSLEELLAAVRAKPFNGLHQKLIEAMTTRETLFFRDVKPFEVLRSEVIPQVVEQRGADRRLNFWCAASSSGQEPFSVAILLREYFPQLQSWNVRFIASDISREALARAICGRYSQLEVNRGLPASLLVKYFMKHGNEWEIRDDIRRMIEFRELNLMEPWPFLPRLDIVFLRNVLIYFNLDTKREILHKTAQLLNPWGFLFLGSAETTLNISEEFEPSLGGYSCYHLKEEEKC